jgi:hypothetical protein
MFILLTLLKCALFSYAETTTTPPTLGFPIQSYSYPIPETEDCTTLPVGQTRVVRMTDQQSHTRVGGRYTIARQSQNLYRIDLNLRFNIDSVALQEFQQTSGLPPGRARQVANEEMIQRMEQRTQRCLQEVEGRLRSPDGTQFKIFINSPTARRRAPQVAVRIHGSEFRNENAFNWSSHSECYVLIHEVFHLLGLADGYPPNALSDEQVHRQFHSCVHSEDRGMCRHYEPEGIMNNFAAALGYASYEAIRCVRNQESSIPREYREVTEIPTQCPDGYTLRARTRVGLPMSAIRNSESTPDGSIIFLKRYQSSSTTALLNAHTRLIINPNCVSQNRDYLTCIQNAGQQDCLPTPSFCNGSNFAD